MKYLIFLVPIILVSCKLTNTTQKIPEPEPKPHFRNQGEQEDYWAKQVFAKEYTKSEYPKFVGEIKIVSDSKIQFNEIQYAELWNSKPEYKLIFENGLLYPEILGFDNLQIRSLEELTFLSNSPTVKRFRFLLFSLAMNPDVYLFELTNETANKNTNWESFIENAKLTFIKYGWTMI